jgi:hypothetical protein
MAFDMPGACKLAAAAPGDASDPAYWQKTLVYCQALAGQKDQAALGVGLLRERKVSDPVFFSLIDDINGLGNAKLDKLTKPSALTLAMSRSAKASLPAGVLKDGSPALLRFLALNPDTDDKTRLDAAERAEAAGVLTSAALREAYGKITFSKELQANPLAAAETDGGPVGRALLYRTAMDQPVAAVRAETLAQAFKLAVKAGRYPTVARTFQPLVAAVQPTQELAWFAPDAARALLVAGSTDNVGAWLALARGGTDAKQFVALLPLARLAGVEGTGTGDPDLTAWARSVADAPGGNERIALVYGLLDGLGDGVSDGAWIGLLQSLKRTQVDMPAPVVWYRLEQAAAGNRLGETVSLALIALGNDGTHDANPVVLRAAIKALVRVGEQKAARSLAVEAAVGAGL